MAIPPRKIVTTPAKLPARLPARPAPVAKAPPGRIPPRAVVPGRPAVRRPSAPAEDGFTVAREQKEVADKKYAKRKEQPFRLRMQLNETRDVVVVDKGMPFFLHEHHWKGKDGKWNQFEVCRKTAGICPLCNKLDKESYYAMVMTVIDLQSYKDKNGKLVRASKKLLVIKLGMIAKYERLYKQYGTLRGVKLQLARDGSKAPNTGDGVVVLEKLSEVKLAAAAKSVDPKNELKLLDAVKYDIAFEMLSEEDMLKVYGGSASPGSEDFGGDDQGTVAFGGDNGALDDEVPF